MCDTIYKLNTENVIKTFFITNRNMQLTGGEKQWLGCSFVISSPLAFVRELDSFVSANHSCLNPWCFQKPQVFSIDKSVLLLFLF